MRDSLYQLLNVVIRYEHVKITLQHRDRQMDQENGIESLRTDPFMHGNLYITEMAFQTLRKAGLS